MYSSKIVCIHCGSIGHVIRWGMSRQKRVRYRCRDCRKTFCARTGTIKYKTRLNEKQWALVPSLVALRTHPSGADLGRLLQISVRSGQRMMRHIRHLLPDSDPRQRIGGTVELDETTFKGTWIGGAKERGGALSLMPLVNRTTRSMNQFVDRLVVPDAMVFTDEWRGYNEVCLTRGHLTVCHAREFVSSFCRKVHTNGIEGVWGYAKPLAIHTYRGYPTIADFLREICFQFNFTYHERRSYLTAYFSRPHITNTLCR